MVSSKTFNNMLFTALLAASMTAVLVSGFQFEVGEKTGWKKPTGKEPETYNEWAAKNRFRIGDTLNFKYQNDSVLVVSSSDYLNCNTANPIARFDDGNTVFQFDRSGFFYFISGQPGHCKSGERLIVRVMHPSEVEAPEHAPSPAVGDESGESGAHANSTTKMSVISYSITALAGVLVIVYLFS